MKMYPAKIALLLILSFAVSFAFGGREEVFFYKLLYDAGKDPFKEYKLASGISESTVYIVRVSRHVNISSGRGLAFFFNDIGNCLAGVTILQNFHTTPPTTRLIQTTSVLNSETVTSISMEAVEEAFFSVTGASGYLLLRQLGTGLVQLQIIPQSILNFISSEARRHFGSTDSLDIVRNVNALINFYSSSTDHLAHSSTGSQGEHSHCNNEGACALSSQQ